MSKLTPTQAKLASSSPPQAIKQDRSSVSEIHRNLVYADEKVAVQIAQDQAVHEADKVHGAELKKLELTKAELDPQYEDSSLQLAELTLQLRTTPQYIKHHKASGEDQGITSFQAWRCSDQVAMVLVLLGLVCTLIMGAANVFVNLVSSGQVIFIQKPWLAFFIAMLMPTGSIAIKFISHFFDNYRSKKRFTLSIYSLSGVVLLLWSIAFSLNYSGAAGGVDWDSLGEASGKGSLLVWLQLVAEILVAASLALAAEDIYLQYSPVCYIENPVYNNLAVSLKQHRRDHDFLSEERRNCHARLEALYAARKAMINDALAGFAAYRAQYAKANNF